MIARALTSEDFAAATNVSRETMGRLQIYAATLEKWQPKINLVGASTLNDLWQRHFLDSAQLTPYLGDSLCDLGSGAGFPGLVLSIITGKNAILIESDQRKSAFLREVIRQTGANAIVFAQRIEDCRDAATDTVIARALAPLPTLMAWAGPILARSGALQTRAIFLKGQNVEGEIETLSKMWDFAIELKQSVTDPSGVIVVLKNPRRKA